jgi:hypothetical protein
MASIPLSASAVDALKNGVHRFYDERKSSHITEAIAAALGFNTHAALMAELKKNQDDPFYYLLNAEKFDVRMQTLGYSTDPDFIFENVKVPEIISTTCHHAHKYDYNTSRQKAW